VGVTELLRSVFDGRTRERFRDELPKRPPTHEWVSSQPKSPRERPRIVANIRANPSASVGDCRRPAALGTMIEGALAFALDDAIDGRCQAIEVRLCKDGSASVTHEGPGYSPPRASSGLQRWPWLRRSPEGEIILTQNYAAPVVTCALSHWCRIEIRLAGEIWRQAFYRGEAECMLRRERVRSTTTRTCVRFRPDPLVFPDPRFDIDDLYMRALGLMMELSGIELRIIDERYPNAPLVFTGTGPQFDLAVG
jgi:DNA gyrase subunit B